MKELPLWKLSVISVNDDDGWMWRRFEKPGCGGAGLKDGGGMFVGLGDLVGRGVL